MSNDKENMHDEDFPRDETRGEPTASRTAAEDAGSQHDSQCTPGPWIWEGGGHGNQRGSFHVTAANDGVVICGRMGWPTNAAESEANARLIAAAPELYAALKNIAGYPLPVYTKDGEEFVPLSNADYLRTLAKEALAKAAEGGQ